MNTSPRPSDRGQLPAAGQTEVLAGGVSAGGLPAADASGRSTQANPETAQHALGPFAGRAERDVPGYSWIAGATEVDPLTALKNTYGDVRDFLRGGRTPNYRWWKPLVALCCIAIF